MKNKKYHTVGTVPISNPGLSVKYDGVKLCLWPSLSYYCISEV